jgi:membrane protein implicated in regulation of membrane protease activity
MSQPGRTGNHTATWTIVTLLLVVGIAGTLIVPVYARTTPTLGGFPFFYWYQLVWIPLVAILATLAYLLTRRAARPRDGQQPGAPAGPAGEERRDEPR